MLYYGAEDSRHALPEIEHVSDSRRCLRCDADLEYSEVYYAHLGHYSCPACGWSRPTPRVSASKLDLEGIDGSRIETVTPTGALELELPLGGLFNAYNALAATAAATALGIESSAVVEAVSAAESAFGRMERFTVGGKNACLALVKNPSGYNVVLELLLADEHTTGLLLALNDDGPDGRDVSWMWDVDLERCRDAVKFVICSGRRSQDLALRLKYAELDKGRLAARGDHRARRQQGVRAGTGEDLRRRDTVCVPYLHGDVGASRDARQIGSSRDILEELNRCRN